MILDVQNTHHQSTPAQLQFAPPQAKASKLQTLCSFLPAIVLRKLSCLTRDEASAMRPSREDFHACAVVMLDMWVVGSLFLSREKRPGNYHWTASFSYLPCFPAFMFHCVLCVIFSHSACVWCTSDQL